MSQVSIIDIEGNNPQIPTQFNADVGFAIPIGNVLNIYGSAAIPGTTPVSTTGAGNTITVLVQRSQAIAATNATNVGLSAFNSAQFSVDANGFVSLMGGGLAIDSIAVQAGTSPIVPTAAGLVTINGAVVAAGTNPIRSNGTGANTMAMEVQISQAVGATDATRIGLSNFNSAQFTVDGNGFVSTSGTGVGNKITGQSGGALSPTLGNWNIFGASTVAGTSPVVTSGAISTLTVNVQRSQALAAADSTKVGLANFDSSSFAVDANGFVTLAGGGLAVDSFQVQAITAPGVNPVAPTGAGLITFNGAAVANHSVPLETRSRALNAMNVEVQYATTAAATDATKSGIAHFDSTAFTVDASGFVQLAGGAGPAIDSIAVDTATGPGTNPVVPTGAGVVTVTGAQVATGTVGANVIRSNSVAANAYRIEIQRSTAVAATDSTKNGVSHYDSAVFSVDASGFVSSNATGLVKTLTPDLDFDGTAATPVSPQAGNINVLSYNPSVASVTNTYNSTGVSTGNIQVEHKAWLTALVVDPSTTIGTRGTFSTISSALTAASSGQTIFIRPGTYTENITLKAGVNLSSFQSSSSLDATGQVIISGTCTMTTAGSVTISGIQLQTNSAALLAVTGSAASIVNLNNCYLNCSNTTGITFSSSNAAARINIAYCYGSVGTTGIAYFSHSSAGTMNIYYSRLFNPGLSLTANTVSAGTCTVYTCNISTAFTSSSTGALGFFYSDLDLSAINTTCVTAGGSSHHFLHSTFISGTASALSISQTVNMECCTIGSSNTNAITGAGTVNYGGLTFQDSSSNINTTTQSLLNTGPSTIVGSSNSGNTNTLTVSNSSNTATSAAILKSSVAGSTAADPTHQSIVSGVTTWTWGIDNSVTSPTADPWVLSQGTALGTNDVMSVATTGEINYPLQSAFSAFVGSNVANATGDGTTVTVIAGTEIFDQNSDYNNATGVFTAPVTGRYRFSCGGQIGSVGAGHTSGVYQIVSSNRNVETVRVSPAAVKDSNSVVTLGGNVFIDMDAADTMTWTITVSNSTKTVSINGTGTVNMNTFITGQLEC